MGEFVGIAEKSLSSWSRAEKSRGIEEETKRRFERERKRR